MDIKHCYCIILAGGPGTRFWPLSKTAKPKQFLDVADSGKTFIRQTYERFSKVIPQENIIIVTAYRYRELVMEQIPELEKKNLLLEPYQRNTAPAVAYATYSLLIIDPEAHVVVAPSDHFIQNEELFCKTIEYAFDFVAEKDVLMTLGLVPTRPDSNYGYIQACGGQNAYKNDCPMEVKTFTEKPDKELARVFINTGEFFWNSGIFIWKAKTIKEEMERLRLTLLMAEEVVVQVRLETGKMAVPVCCAISRELLSFTALVVEEAEPFVWAWGRISFLTAMAGRAAQMPGTEEKSSGLLWKVTVLL